MKCSYCGKEINENDKYCQFCGAEAKKQEQTTEKTEESRDTGRVGQPIEKKKANPKKIILTVVGVVTAIHLVGWAILLGILAALGITPSNYVEKIYEFEEYFEDYDDGMYDEDFYNDFFNDIDDFDNVDDFDDLDDIDDFKAGVVDTNTNSYICKMANISITLPEDYNVYSEKEIEELYQKTNITDSMRKRNALVYDFYAKNPLGTKIVYVDFINKDYYSEYKDLNSYIKHVKETYTDYERSGYGLEFAEDSMFYPHGKDSKDISFHQIAARLTDANGKNTYDYSFVSEIDDYYVLITICAPELSDISVVLDSMNTKK